MICFFSLLRICIFSLARIYSFWLAHLKCSTLLSFGAGVSDEGVLWAQTRHQSLSQPAKAAESRATGWARPQRKGRWQEISAHGLEQLNPKRITTHFWKSPIGIRDHSGLGVNDGKRTCAKGGALCFHFKVKCFPEGPNSLCCHTSILVASSGHWRWSILGLFRWVKTNNCPELHLFTGAGLFPPYSARQSCLILIILAIWILVIALCFSICVI